MYAVLPPQRWSGEMDSVFCGRMEDVAVRMVVGDADVGRPTCLYQFFLGSPRHSPTVTSL